MRVPGPADEVQQRESDRDPDAPEHAEHGDAGERHHRQRELRASPVEQAPCARDVDQAHDRDDHDRRERRLRQIVHETGSNHQQHRQDAGADQPGDLAARADVLGDGRARAARGDGESLEEPGRDVRDAERRELLVLVDLLAKPARVAARQDARVGERDEGDPDRRREQRLEIVERHIGQPEARQAGRDVADDRHLIGETQRRDHGRRADDRDEDTRHLRRDPTQAEDQHERPDADRERGRVGLVESCDEVAHSPQEALRVDREPEELRELRDDHGDGDAHQVAEAHGHRQQFGHEAEAREPAREHDRTDEECEQSGERDPSRLVPGRRQRHDRRGDERRDRRVGSQDEDPRRAQQEVHDKRHECRVEPGDRRQARELGVCHALRDEQRGEHDARDDVAAQVGAAAASQQLESRRPTTKSVRAFHERDPNASAYRDDDGSRVCSGGQSRMGAQGISGA